MIDPGQNTVTVDRLDDGATFTRIGVLGSDGLLTTPLLSGWALPLSQLFA